MFFGAERLVEMRRFILSSSYEQRVEALNNIRKYQVEDFEAIFRLSGERLQLSVCLIHRCMSFT